MKICPLEAWLLKIDGRTDGQTLQANSSFSKFCKHVNKLSHKIPIYSTSKEKFYMTPNG